MRTRPNGILIVLAAVLALSATPHRVSAQADGAPRSHRAVYDISLESVTDRSGINGIFGRMVHEVRYSDCGEVRDDFRFVTQLVTEDFTRLSDQRARTVENMEEGTFRFAWQSFVDDALESEYEGLARRENDGLAVTLDEPEDETLSLAPAIFPNAHVRQIIEAAETNESFLQARLYDGAEEGRQVVLTTAVIGNAGDAADEERAILGQELAEAGHWPVTLSYFSEDEGGDELPDYQISFKLHESTVIHDLVMDYGEYVLAGTLRELEMLEDVDCSS